MTWTVSYSNQAELDLRGIFEYIAYSLLEPETAAKQTRRIAKAISELDHMPLRHSPYNKEPWKSLGLRFVPVDNFIVLYLPREPENTVTIIRIMYGGRDIEEQLKQSGIIE